MTDTVIKFWKEWIESSPLRRIDMVQSLASQMDIVKVCSTEIDDSTKLRIVGNLMNSYFEDLYYYTMIPIIKEKSMHPAQLGVKS